MTFRFSVVEIDTTIESSPLWFLIGFRLQVGEEEWDTKIQFN